MAVQCSAWSGICQILLRGGLNDTCEIRENDVPRPRLELGTTRLKAGCSTVELTGRELKSTALAVLLG